ncbi:MAG: hypothetical protein H0W78_13350 [Planctomycetes bacterium]|nr:hypothetical protein [Planctomycetota bacterium]
MADQTNPPAKPDPAESKDDAKKDKDSFALPKNQQLSTTQQVFVWALVLFVGVLFGAGPIADTLLGNTDRVEEHAGVSENDILGRQSVARRLQDLLNPERDPSGEYFDPMSYNRQIDIKRYWAYRIKMTRRADALGLLPNGGSLDKLVKEFLNKPVPGNATKRYVDALQEVEGTDAGVTLLNVHRYVAEDRALRLISAARLVAPVVPAAAGDLVPPMNQMDYFRGNRGDQVAIDEVVLSATHLLPEIKEDDLEIQQTFERLKGVRFISLTAIETTVAYVDVAALAAKTVVPDANIEAYYNAHKDDYRKPPEPVKPEEKKPEEKKPEENKPDAPAEAKPEEKPPTEPKIEFRPLSEVAAEIKSKLARELAEKQSEELVQQFDAAVEPLLSDKDNTRFKAKASELGLLTREKVFIEEPRSGGTLDAGEFGMLSETQLHLFNQEQHAITSAVKSTGDKAAWLVLRIDGRREAGFRELSDPSVKAEVKAVLQGERAYKDLLTKAEEIRAAAEKLGPGGLKKWAESEAAKPWSAKLASRKEPVFDINPFQQGPGGLSEIVPPPAAAGEASSLETKPLVALAVAERPVVLGYQEPQGDVPAVRLVQVTDYLPEAPVTGTGRVERAQTYRAMLLNYRQFLLQQQMNSELEKN